MFDRIRKMGVAVILRALPGFANLACLVLVGHRLETGEFGMYSTLLATYNLLATIIYGPLLLSIVSHYPKVEATGNHLEFQSALLCVSIGITVFLAGIFFVVALFGIEAWIQFFLLTSFGIFKVFQELLRAKLRIYAYALSGLIQSFGFFFLLYFFLGTKSGHSAALAMLAIGNWVAIGASLLLAGIPFMTRPRFSLLDKVLSVGLPYTLSSLSEGGVFLGVRYVVMLLGSPAQLGVFSFCVDLAQRTVGFIVNVAGFIHVPMAFKYAAIGAEYKFRNELLSASLMSGLTAFSVLLILVGLSYTELYSSMGLKDFSRETFFLVGLAVIINRLKKILLDPVLIRNSRMLFLSYGYLSGALLAIVVSFCALLFHWNIGVEIAYLFGYVVAFYVSYGLFQKKR